MSDSKAQTKVEPRQHMKFCEGQGMSFMVDNRLFGGAPAEYHFMPHIIPTDTRLFLRVGKDKDGKVIHEIVRPYGFIVFKLLKLEGRPKKEADLARYEEAYRTQFNPDGLIELKAYNPNQEADQICDEYIATKKIPVAAHRAQPIGAGPTAQSPATPA